MGIGSTSPTAKFVAEDSFGNFAAKFRAGFSGGVADLTLDNNGDGSRGRIVFSQNGITDGGITYTHHTTDANQKTLGFDVAGGTAELVILGNGRVGIGTITPNTLLHLYADNSAAQGFTLQNLSTNPGADIFTRWVVGNEVQVYTLGIDNSDNDTLKLTDGSNPSTGNVFLSVNTSGNIGVNTATPQRKLSVDGAVYSKECQLTDSGTVTFNLQDCNQGVVTLGGNRTIDFTNEAQAPGQTVRLILCQDTTGSRTVNWDSAVRWSGGNAPTLTTTPGKCDVFAGFVTEATGTPVIILGGVLNF